MKELSRTKKIILSAGLVILVTLLLIASSKGLIVSANKNASLIKTPGLYGPFADEISILETNIARSPNEEVRRGEEKRLQMVGREATIVAEARNAEATSGLPTPVPTQLIELTVQVFNETQQKPTPVGIDRSSVCTDVGHGFPRRECLETGYGRRLYLDHSRLFT